MAKLISSPNKIKLNPPIYPASEPEPLWSSLLNGGMVSSIDDQNLSDSQQGILKNMIVRFDHTSRRFGTKLFIPAKPNANKILGWFLYQKSDGSEKLLRFTKDSIHAAGSASWAALAGGALSGTDNNRWRTTILEDRMFATNDGVDVIQEINILANTYAALGNAPKYKYIAGFGDRVVGFSLAGGVPVGTQLGWSGNRAYAEWNPLVNQSAGSKVLTTSASDVNDFGSGIFSFGTVLVLLRNRSIWEATLQPISTNPFNCYQRIPNVGSDSPDSIAKTATGVCFLDTRTRAVYLYKLDGSLSVISDPIKNDLLGSISDPSLVFGSYNQSTNEYSVCIPGLSTLVREWVFNFDSKAWSYYEIESISHLANLDYASGGLTIDELVGSIDQLIGTIDGLAPGKAVTKFYGRTDGEILVEDSLLDTDNSISYNSEFRSKDWTLPANKRFINRLHLEFVPRKAGNITISYSKDAGKNWVVWKVVNFVFADVNSYKEIVCKKLIQGRRFMFRVTSTEGLFELVKYAIYSEDSGEAKNK